MSTDTFGRVSLDPNDPRPSHIQVAAVLRREIESGTLAGRLPRGEDLAKRFGVARFPTLKKALDVLEAEGLVTTVRGKGTFTLPR